MTAQRIALVGAAESVATFRAGPRRLVRAFADLHAELPAIVQFAPQVLIWAAPGFGEREAGAADLLAALLPATQLAVLIPAEQEADAARRAAAHSVQLLTRPLRPEAVVALLAGEPGVAPAALLEPMVELVTGLTDALNNPLQLAQGHLQLLRANLPATAADLRAHADAMLDALRRVDATLQALRAVARPAARRADVTPAELAEGAARMLPPALGERLRQAPAPARTLQLVPGPWQEVIRRLLEIALALSRDDQVPEISWHDDGPSLRADVTLPPTFPAWRLPPSFAPFLLTRVLRETPQMLALFLVQTLAAAHGGAARGFRLDAERLRLEVVMA